MAYNVDLAYGMNRLLDTHLEFFRPGKAVYLRLRNFPDIQDETFAQLGFSVAVTGTPFAGTTDVLIQPQPSVRAVSTHNIGQSLGKLRFGAKDFLISQTFVKKQMAARNFTEEDLVWRAPDVVGLVNSGQLYSIENITNEQVAAQTVSWILTCNAVEVPK